MNDEKHRESVASTWIVILLLLSLIIGKGLYAFGVIGDLGQPNWDYGTVRDVPAQSPYAEYDLLPYPQHIRGERGE